ncbi:MAG: hypothetical protein E7231_00695 [Cellulosilyticum sp.]|nr:hypothetical protein [Cellulosilyticum sp.]
MRSLSNIIKGGRIRSQSYLDLSQRLIQQSENKYDIGQYEEEVAATSDETIELIHKREQELALIEEEIEKKRKDADNKIESLLSEAIAKGQAIEKEAKEKESLILAEAYQKQAEIIQLASEEANQTRKMAEDEKRALLESVEGEVVETMISLLQHIISEELEHNVEWLRLVVRKMLLSDQVSEKFKLYVSTNNMQRIEEDRLAFMEGLSKIAHIESDETLKDTACILETSQGCIEYDVSNGLEKMITELRILQGIS